MMSITVKDIYRHLDERAPFSIQAGFDNAGFLVGRGDHIVTRVLISLDITEAVVAEAVESGAALIVSHHPVVFHPLLSLTDEKPTGRILLTLAEHGIAAICAHTNLDATADGVNDALAQQLELTQIAQLRQEGIDPSGRPYGIGRVGIASGSPQNTPNYASFVKKVLGANGVRYVDAQRPVHRVAVGSGACADMMEDVLALGCDTFITSDVKYNGFLDAQAMGLNLIDAGHFPTENVICPVLEHWISDSFPEITVSCAQCHHEVLSYL